MYVYIIKVKYKCRSVHYLPSIKRQVCEGEHVISIQHTLTVGGTSRV